VEAAGGLVVWDDLCTGTRYFEREPPPSATGLEAVAARLLRRPLCPAKHAGLGTRSEDLLQAVREHRAQGVIFVQLKFCDPHSFDHPHLKEALDAADIPSMLYEIDEQSFSGGQLATRVQAFIEML
jgi:benzoyl-CoA reductase/2-hydroxyglutaryl-CoA dehydratase subunit BcrC/BadD/HgdB